MKNRFSNLNSKLDYLLKNNISDSVNYIYKFIIDEVNDIPEVESDRLQDFINAGFVSYLDLIIYRGEKAIKGICHSQTESVPIENSLKTGAGLIVSDYLDSYEGMSDNTTLVLFGAIKVRNILESFAGKVDSIRDLLTVFFEYCKITDVNSFYISYALGTYIDEMEEYIKSQDLDTI